MKRWYVHGTSFESANSMINGEKRKYPRTWNCSDYNKIYVRCISEEDVDGNNLVEVTCNHDYSDFVYDMFRQAIGNASITAAAQASMETQLALMFFQIDDKDVALDVSCPGMDNCYMFNENIFKEVYKFTVFCDSYIPLYRVMYLTLSNDYLNIDTTLDYYEEALVESIEYRDVLDDIILEKQENGLYDSGVLNCFMKRKDEYCG